MSRRLILPKTARDLLNPARQADLKEGVRILNALQRLKLVINSGGQTSQSAIQISPGASLLAGSVTTLDPETIIWRDRCKDAGGVLSGASIEIADRLIKAIKEQSYNLKIMYLLPLLGGDLACARVPLRDKLGVGIATNTNFVEADFTQATGLQGNGTTKYLDSLIAPSSLGTTNNGGLGWWENNINLAGNTDVMGCYKEDNIPDSRFVIDLRTARAAFWWAVSAGAVGDGALPGNGSYYGQRSSATVRQIFKNGALGGINTVSDAGVGSSDNTILICGADAGVSGVRPWPGRCAAAYMTTGTLTTAEVASLHSLLSRYLITPTGR